MFKNSNLITHQCNWYISMELYFLHIHKLNAWKFISDIATNRLLVTHIYICSTNFGQHTINIKQATCSVWELNRKYCAIYGAYIRSIDCIVPVCNERNAFYSRKTSVFRTLATFDITFIQFQIGCLNTLFACQLTVWTAI